MGNPKGLSPMSLTVLHTGAEKIGKKHTFQKPRTYHPVFPHNRPHYRESKVFITLRQISDLTVDDPRISKKNSGDIGLISPLFQK